MRDIDQNTAEELIGLALNGIAQDEIWGATVETLDDQQTLTVRFESGEAYSLTTQDTELLSDLGDVLNGLVDPDALGIREARVYPGEYIMLDTLEDDFYLAITA